MCPCLQAENKKIEAYLKTRCGGHIRAAYGCSLGGSFVGLLVARQNIHTAYGILGNSDLDQVSPLAAKLQADFLLPLIAPVVRDGKLKAKSLQKRLDKHARELGGLCQGLSENVRRGSPAYAWTQIINGLTIYTDTALKAYLEQAGFCKMQRHKNKNGWLRVTAQKR